MGDYTTAHNATPTVVPHNGDEWAGPDDRCSCGRPAIIVYLTEQFGRVGYCGIPNAKPLSGQRDDTVAETRDDRPHRARRPEGGRR
jgi:hypothetical protein